MYSFHLFLIYSVSTRSLQFLSFIVPIFGWKAPLMFPIFLKRSLLPLLLFSSFIKHCLLKKASLPLSVLLFGTLHLVGYNFPFLSCFLLSLLSSAICKASSDDHLTFLLFFFFEAVLLAASCTILQTSVPSSSGCFLGLIP